jgi:transposase
LTLAKRQSSLGASWSRVPFLAGRLRFSGAMFVECFPTQRQDAFLLGQRHAVEFWEGVPRMAVYDNLKPAVLQVLQGHSRREHEVFLHFHSVYREDRALCQCPCWVGERQCRKSGVM